MPQEPVRCEDRGTGRYESPSPSKLKKQMKPQSRGR
jgi:hypothetical protein